MSQHHVPRRVFPRLIVRGTDAAIAFYQNSFGAELMERFAGPDGLVSHASLTLGDYSIALSEEVPDWGWVSPMSLGGSPVLIQLDLEDCEMVAHKMLTEGAEVVIPIKDRPYGKREGRIRDPFGHLWILSQQVAK
ncbi:VOC family protein [Rhizobium laguerreae]|uniref:VOC family protein n=1 Tax=Rhizobium laguerreae TaxID=1076926 RepID=UPI001C9075EC|nr:VOC family protein [Rhizobium laguerreae]MBY3217735.1 VOC family protein [Rhizobium laguerreae]